MTGECVHIVESYPDDMTPEFANQLALRAFELAIQSNWPPRIIIPVYTGSLCMAFGLPANRFDMYHLTSKRGVVKGKRALAWTITRGE